MALVLHNRTLDVFVNGKLRRSCQYAQPPVNNEGDLHITDKGGFSGHIADLQYFNINISPEKVYSLYNAGVSEPGYWERLGVDWEKLFLTASAEAVHNYYSVMYAMLSEQEDVYTVRAFYFVLKNKVEQNKIM